MARTKKKPVKKRAKKRKPVQKKIGKKKVVNKKKSTKAKGGKKPTPPKPSATRLPLKDRLIRIEAVRNKILEGDSATNICQFVAVNYKVSERQAFRYISTAREAIEKETEPVKEKQRMTHYARRNRLFNLACGTGDVKTALEVLKDLAELQGLYPKKKDTGVNVNIVIGKLKETLNTVTNIIKSEVSDPDAIARIGNRIANVVPSGIGTKSNASKNEMFRVGNN